MAKRNRDEFSAQVKQTLAFRVGTRCSNPDCRVSTTGPTTKAAGVSNIGKAAHIAAASAGGPRYDATMTREQRRCISNGIWLCGHHADEIDKDVPKYSVELLHAWKRKAEALAAEEKGRRQPSERELAVYRTKALGANVTGASIGALISDMSRIGVQEIERLDPRFNAKISVAEDGTPTISLDPLETVRFTLCIPLHAADEFRSKWSDLENHGRPLEMTGAGIRIEGSPLFNDREPEMVVMETHFRRQALQRITWSDAQSGKVKTAELHGQIVGGAESVTFSGELFDGLYHLTYQLPITASGLISTSVDGSISFSPWLGRTIGRLPYFDQFFSLCQATSQGQKIDTCLEIDGQEITSFGGLNLLGFSDAVGTLATLDLLAKIRDLVRILGIEVPFQTTVISVEDVQFIANVWFWLCRAPELRGQELGVVKTTINPFGKDEALALKKSISDAKPMAVKVDRKRPATPPVCRELRVL